LFKYKTEENTFFIKEIRNIKKHLIEKVVNKYTKLFKTSERIIE